MGHFQVTQARCSPAVAAEGVSETSSIAGKPAMSLRLDELLTVQLQVGQVKGVTAWVSCAPEVGSVAQGDTQESSLTNLCAIVEDVCDWPRTGGPLSFQAVDVEDHLRPFSHRKIITVTSQLRGNEAVDTLFSVSPSCLHLQ